MILWGRWKASNFGTGWIFFQAPKRSTIMKLGCSFGSATSTWSSDCKRFTTARTKRVDMRRLLRRFLFRFLCPSPTKTFEQSKGKHIKHSKGIHICRFKTQTFLCLLIAVKKLFPKQMNNVTETVDMSWQRTFTRKIDMIDMKNEQSFYFQRDNPWIMKEYHSFQWSLPEFILNHESLFCIVWKW